MRKKSSGRPVWWGEYNIPMDRAGKWQIGPSTFWIERSKHEWKITYERENDPLAPNLEIELPLQLPFEYGPQVTIKRFGMAKTTGKFSITPLLADRPVVIRPETPFYLLSGQDVTLYVSTQLWIKFKTGKPSLSLRDMPIFRPSDTWFGPTSMEGEMCYASRTAGLLQLNDKLFRPHRAVSVVNLINRSKKSIFLERLKLPVPNLTLYQAAKGHLWTQTVSVELKAKNEIAALSLIPKSPAEAGKSKLLVKPRHKPEKSILVRALDYLIR